MQQQRTIHVVRQSNYQINSHLTLIQAAMSSKHMFNVVAVECPATALVALQGMVAEGREVNAQYFVFAVQLAC